MSLAMTSLFIFTVESELGWIGYLRDASQSLIGIRMACGQRSQLFQDLVDGLQQTPGHASVHSWDLQEAADAFDKRLAKRLQQFACGEQVCFDDVCLRLPAATDFQLQVIEHCRKISFGQTLSYGELAEKAGFPGAARAVGSVMANNRFPIVVPCHRVVAANRRLGGFSAASGVELKRRLLANEGAEGFALAPTG